MNELARLPDLQPPALVAAAGERASRRFFEFFVAQIRNPNTRRAYARDVRAFLDWCEGAGIASVTAVTTIEIAAYVERFSQRHPAPTVKRHLAAIRHLFDYLTTGGVLPFNPAAAVRGPKHIVRRGKTPILAADEARALLDGVACEVIKALRFLAKDWEKSIESATAWTNIASIRLTTRRIARLSSH